MKFSFWIYFALISNLANFGYGALEYEILKFEVIHTDGKYLEQNITMKRVSRGFYSADICTTFVEDLPTNSEFELQLLRNAPENSQYISSPIKIPKTKLETFMNHYYKKYFMEDVTKYSNLPVIKGEYKGPFPKGYYWVKDYILNTDNFSGANLPSGLYKGIASWQLDGKLVYKGEATFKLFVKK